MDTKGNGMDRDGIFKNSSRLIRFFYSAMYKVSLYWYT